MAYDEWNWVIGIAIGAVAGIIVTYYYVINNGGRFPQHPTQAQSMNSWPINPSDQQFRAMQYVQPMQAKAEDEAMLQNHEVISWIDSKGRKKQIIIEREVRGA